MPDSSQFVPAHELFAGILERGWYKKIPTNETVEWPIPQMSEEERAEREAWVSGLILSEVLFFNESGESSQ